MRKPAYPCAHALVVLSLLGLVGCYSTVEVGESQYSGVVVKAELSDLPKCKKGAPSIVYYVSSTDGFYWCDGQEYLLLDLRGADGSSCTVTQDNGSATILCEDGTDATVSDGQDGADGADGADGQDGTSCTVVDNGNGTKTISCPDGTSVTVSDGQDGADGTSCTVVDNLDGTYDITCGDDTVTVTDDSCTVVTHGGCVATVSCDDGTFATVQLAAMCVFACTEQGIRAAIDEGGGPHFFACDGPTTVTTQAEIAIDNDVILDGEGNLTVDGGDAHRVFAVTLGSTAELVDLRVTGGDVELEDTLPGRTIRNEGSLTLTDCIVESGGHTDSAHVAIYSDGSLNLRGSVVRDYDAVSHCGGIESVGSLTLMDSTVSEITAFDGHAICSLGSVLLIRSAVVNTPNIGAAILSEGDAMLVNSTVSGNIVTILASSVAAEGTLTLINSTLVFSDGWDEWTISAGDDPDDMGNVQADLFAINSILVGPLTGTCVGFNTFSGGGNIESSGDTCGFDHPTDLVNVSAAELNLGPLADNGGPTLTHALLLGSVAIDHISPAMCLDADGQPLTTDQRGEPRDSMCDVGAFEVQP